MNKIKKLMDKYELTEFQVTKDTGQRGNRTNTLREVADGKREITSINLNLLTSFALGLGLKLEDLLNDYDLDGTTTQIVNINRYINRLSKKTDYNRLDDKNNDSFILNNNNNKLNQKWFKKGYEYLNTSLEHDQQKVNDIYLLNNSYLSNDDYNRTRNKTLANLDARINKYSDSYIIYSKLKTGGDIRIIANVYDKKDNFKFGELFGCEWIDTEDNKSICYYKYHDSTQPINLDNLDSLEKEEISQIEFFRSLQGQLQKFDLH